MKVVHWTLSNTSGLNRMATQISEAECSLGIDSVVAYTDGGGGISSPGLYKVLPMAEALEADIHVMHSWVPPEAKGKRVFFAHGTPEHCFHLAVQQGEKEGYTAGDALMLSYYNIDNMEITVTFWPRHAYIWQTFNPKAHVRVIPMGVKTSQWHKVDSRGKYAGDPSVFMAENCHNIKWPLDIILAWPYIMKRNLGATLHIHYIPHNLHRYFYPLIFQNGTSFKSFTSGTYFPVEELRNAFVSVDYYLSLVRYGDFNTICMEAKACETKVISYRGNPYADYWITEGDQRTMAEELLQIFRGEAIARQPDIIPSIQDTAEAMKKIYEEVL